MASPHELSGGSPNPYQGEVESRNARILERYSREKKIKVTEQLEALAYAHPGLINAEIIPAVASAEGNLAAHSAMVERETGLMNDKRSKQPGVFITGILDYRKIEQLRVMLDGLNPTKVVEEVATEYDLQVIEEDLVSSNELRYSLHLPKGAFEYNFADLMLKGPEDQEHLHIYPVAEVGPDEIKTNIVLPMLHGGYVDQGLQNATGNIGRIEGAGGTLWQNPKVNPDGTHKEVQVAA